MGPFRAGTLLVEVRDQMIQPQQKENTNPKANDRRQEGPGPCPGGLIHGGDQQAPDRRGHHDAGGEAGQPPLHPIHQTFLQEKDAGGPQRGAHKRDQQTINNRCLHGITPALAFRLLLRVAVPPTAMFAVVFPAAASAVRVCRVQVQKIDFDGAFLRSQGFQVIEHNLSSFLS